MTETLRDQIPAQRSAKSRAHLQEKDPWSRPVWSDQTVSSFGLPVVDVPFVTVGGGLASFAIADFLRIAGVPAADIAVLTPMREPHETYRHLVRTSQIPDDEPLRSDSMSRIDNIWGWPSYALQQAAEERSAKPLWSVLTEPFLSDFFNPRAGSVYRGLEREAARIGWEFMLAHGRASVVRRRQEGGFFVALEPVVGSLVDWTVIYRCRFVHLGVGYPSLRYLPDVQTYRMVHRDPVRVVNAYEGHEHVYESLSRRSGTVVVRGAGIVASRILQRLLEVELADGTPSVTIVHLFRTYVAGARGPRRFRRAGGQGFTYQPFTFAKAAGGGQLRAKTLKLEGQDRADFIKSIGGTTTAKRRHWQRMLEGARRSGRYRQMIGEIATMSPGPEDTVHLLVRGTDATESPLAVDFVIDATGLEADMSQHPLLADLLDNGMAGKNPMGRLDVDRYFRVRGSHSGAGRMYASGAITLGGYLAPVDSFWGFEHAALEICDDLARQGFCKRIGLGRSVLGWWRWLRGSPL